MAERWDVVIVGGGVIGSACAYFLAAADGFDGRVLVVERDPTYANGSTARSAGGIRQQFSTPENILMSRFAADFLRAAPDLLAVDGDRPMIPFVEQGYLLLASADGVEALRANVAVQHEYGAATELLEGAALGGRFPWLATGGLAAGAFGPRDEGWTDPYALLQAFRRKARALGAVFRDDEVIGIEREGETVGGVILRDGGRVGCGTVVNAAGPRARDVAAMARLELAVFPRKRYVFVFDCRTDVSSAPLTVDPSGVYFRPEGERYICGLSPPPDADPDCLDLEVDHAWFEERIWPVLAARVPAFEAIKLTNAWAGHYAYNPFDQNAILGPHPDCPRFLLANGFSGHGLQQSPAVGRAIAELIVHGAYRSLDLSRFAYDRVARQRPVVERNVV